MAYITIGNTQVGTIQGLQLDSSTGALLTTTSVPANTQVVSTPASQFPANAVPFTVTGTSVSNTTAQTLTVAANTTAKNYALGYLVKVIGATASSTAPSVTIKDGNTALLVDSLIPSATVGSGVSLASGMPIAVGSLNSAMTLVVSSAGSNTNTTQSIATIWGYTV